MNTSTTVPSILAAAEQSTALSSASSRSSHQYVPGGLKDEAEVMKQFESVMLSMVLKQMRQAGSEENGLFPGDKSDTLGGMFDTYMGEHLAESGGFGLMESFEGKLGVAPGGMTPVQAAHQLRQQAMEAYSDAGTVTTR